MADGLNYEAHFKRLYYVAKLVSIYWENGQRVAFAGFIIPSIFAEAN